MVREDLFEPRSGIGQGDPFSPILFAFCVSCVLYPVEEIPRTNPYKYVDDLCVLMRGMHIGHLLQQVYDCHFALFSGVHGTLAKCGVVVKGSLHAEDHAHVEAMNSSMATSGVKQRCATRPLDFCEVMELVLWRWLRLGLEAFAFIDNLTIAADTEEDLRSVLIQAQSLFSIPFHKISCNFFEDKNYPSQITYQGRIYYTDQCV